MTSLYHRLPHELQKLVRDYFSIWQRKGFRTQPSCLNPSPDKYYRTVRHVQRLRWNREYPTRFYFRRQRHFFQSKLNVYTIDATEDAWTIEISPQWNTTDQQTAHTCQFLNSLFQSEIWIQVDPPEHARLSSTWYTDNPPLIGSEFNVVRPTPSSHPSRQHMIVLFTEYIVALSSVVEDTKKKWTP